MRLLVFEMVELRQGAEALLLVEVPQWREDLSIRSMRNPRFFSSVLWQSQGQLIHQLPGIAH
jgi:hypothetical protein